ncbi:peptidase S41 [Pseudoalteromonas phenolica]|uniref:Peptidase S41 n=1 Tax=Pseudoalteromonas phenolica TaxID=161398 RepID=A0A4Q7ILR6_9GAMM|nr:S41 family peptidase [Pseudoalteromonas phenolica]RZQ52691.1 peptidase S41 [Pseudoalteromonas phenolica]
MKLVYRLLVITLCSFATYADTLSIKQQQAWLEDINFFENQVRTKHIEPFHTLAENDFARLLKELKQDLPLLSEPQVEARLMAITGAIGDGHSNYFMMSGPHQHFPLRYKFFDNKLHVIDATKPYQHLIGAELKTINGLTVEGLFELITPLLPGIDNQFSAKTRFEFYLTLHKLLLGLGLIKESAAAQFEFELGGNTLNEQIIPVAMSEFAKLSSAFKNHSDKFNMLDIGMPGISLNLLKENKVAYFDFNAYPSFEQVIAKCKALLKQLKAAKSKYLIIDFRGNGGGSFYNGLAFSSCLLPLDQFDWKAGVFVLTDEHTFSAAMSNTVQFKQILNARIFGTPTGGDPNQFSESYRFVLPNSKRKLSVSKRYYPFLFEDTDAVYPDELIETSWLDYQQGNDTVLSAVLTEIEKIENNTCSN